MLPIPHMSLDDAALACAMSVAIPRTLVHLVPTRCQVPAPGWVRPCPPNSQTLLGPSATMSVNWPRVPQPPLGMIFQAEPFQCSNRPFR